MADTVVYDPSPAYAVLEFRHDSPESVGAGGVLATAEERQHDLVTTLEEAGLIHKVHNDTILDVAPATRCVPRGDPLFARTLLLGPNDRTRGPSHSARYYRALYRLSRLLSPRSITPPSFLP